MRSTLTLTSLLLLPAAASAQSREQQQIILDTRTLQDQVQQLRAQVSQLTEVMKALGVKIDEQSQATQRGFADQRTVINSLTDNSRTMKGKLDDTNLSLMNQAADIQALRQLVSTLSGTVNDAMARAATPVTSPAGAAPGSAGTPGEPPPTSAAGPPAPSQTPGCIGQSPTVIWDGAWGDNSAGHYDLAIEGFRTYIKCFPNGPQAAEAQYNIGNALFMSQKFPEAVKAFGDVTTLYRGSEFEAWSYYKRGLAYEQLKQYEKARQDYEFVKKTFPVDSSEVLMATQALARLPK